MESLYSLAFHAVGSPDPGSGLSFLHATCINGDIETTIFFLQLSPNVVDTIMVLAVPVLSSSASLYKGKKLKDILDLFDTPSHKSIQELLTLHCKGLEKWPLIHVIARQGNVQHIDKLIAQGFNILVEESKELPMILHLAAEHNSVEVVKELLHLGASLRSKDDRGFSVIHYAAKAGRTETVLYMLDRDMSLRDAVGQSYCTPLHLAAWEGHPETAAALIACGADVNAGEKGVSYEEIHCFFKRYDNFSSGVKSHNGEHTICEGNITPILLAARQGHLETFELLEQEGGQYLDQPVLFFAVKGGNLALLKKLVNAGLDVKTRDDEGQTLLHFVNSEEEAEFLLDLGLDVMSLDDHGETPLHCAARNGNTKLAGVLIEHGADVSAKDASGCTPLVKVVISRKCTYNAVAYFAKQLRKCGESKIASDLTMHFSRCFGPGIARILLDVGFDVNQIWQGSTPLHSAVEGDPETARLLVESGAKIHAVNRFGETPFHIAAKWGKTETLRILLLNDANLINAVDSREQTALHRACHGWNRSAECVQFLLDHGSSLNTIDRDGDTALHKVVGQSEPHLQIAEILLKHAASNMDSRSGIVNAVNKKGWTALQSAAACGNACVVQLLLKFGFAIDATDNRGETPLHLTTNVTVFNLLLESGADATIANKEGDNVLHIALYSFNRSTLIIELLLDQRSTDVNSHNTQGKTPLHLTAESKEYEKAKMLLEKGADVNAVDNAGCTPLHLATRGYFSATFCQLLIERGANVNAVNDQGNTALHIAAGKARGRNLASFLIEHGGDVTIANKKGETPNDLLGLRNTGQSSKLRRFVSGVLRRFSKPRSGVVANLPDT